MTAAAADDKLNPIGTRILAALAASPPFLIAALVASGALAHGAVEPWALTAGHAALILAAAAGAWLSIRRTRSLGIPRLPTDLPILLFFAVAALSVAFSLCPQRSWLELFRLLACGLLFVLAASAFRRRRHLLATARALTFLGAVLATLGLTVYGSELLGFRVFSERDHRLALTFANPNHFAALLSMLACLALGLASVRRGARRALLLLSALYLMTAVFFTASRAGIVALGAALALLFAGLFLAGRYDGPRGDGPRRRSLRPLGLTVALTVGAAALLGPRLPLERLETLRDPLGAVAGRQEIWAGTWEMARQRPWTGFGLGTFRDAFTPWKPLRLADRVVQHAHNDYLELAAEAGLPALAAVLLALLAFAAGALSGLRRSDPERQAVGLGAFAGCAALLVHSIADFNLHIPAVAWLFAVLAAMSLAPAQRSTRRLALGSAPRRWTAAAAVGLTAAVALAAVVAPYFGRHRLSEARQLVKERRFAEAKALLEPAAGWPLALPDVRVELGNLELALALQAEPELRQSSLETALAHYDEACRQCPVGAEPFLRRAAGLRHLGRFDDAERDFLRAVELAPLRAAGHLQLAGFYLARGSGGAAAASYTRVLELEPWFARPVFDRLNGAGWSIDRIRDVFPQTANHRGELAAMLRDRSEPGAAAAVVDELGRAFELEPTARRAVWHLDAVFGAGRIERALELAEAYRLRFPDDETLLLQSIGILRKLERPAAAADLYRTLIGLDPADPRRYRDLGNLLCSEDRYREAVAVFAEGESKAQASAELELRLGLCHRRHGRHQPALGALMKAAAIAPAEALYRFHLGEQLRLLGFEERAAAELRACLEIDPELGRCRSALGRLG